MTVETTERKASFAGGQDTNEFTFRALVSAPADIKVLKTLISTGVDTDLAYSTDYTVSVNSDGIGGIVTLTPSVSTLYTTTVYRETTNTQASDYDDYNQFPADTLEGDLDKRTMIDQEQAEALDRTVKVPIASSVDPTLPLPVANYALGWNATGTGLENKSPIDAASVAEAEAARDAAEAARDAAIEAQQAAEAVSGIETASQAEAEAATDNTKMMTALRVKQEVALIANLPVLDEDNMATNSATKVPTQQSVKAYVDVTRTIAQGGTGEVTAQAAIDALTAVSEATAEHVLTKDTATGNAIFKEVPTPATFANVYVADTQKLSAVGGSITENSVGGTTYTKVKEFVSNGTGSLYFSSLLKCSGGSTASLVIYRNGSAVGATKTTSSTTYVEQLETITGWSPGDLIQFYIKSTSGNPAVLGTTNIYATSMTINDE